MGLTQSQKAIVEKARQSTSGNPTVRLSEGACAFVCATVAADLGLLNEFPELPADLPPFFADLPLEALQLPGVDFVALLERLVDLRPDADTYFACLAKLHKTRLKYDRILRTQPFPTFEQVGVRGLLQYGRMSAQALGALLFWRKWLYDLDNRAAQETGYLFEPIIAHAIGGCPAHPTKSPVRRRDDPAKGRQVDCIRGDRAYEFKLRVTMAASGQGRWQEELEFPVDCRASRHIPVLVVLDPTHSPKLAELVAAFRRARGQVYIGDEAWTHLSGEAGPTMAVFLTKYVRQPLEALLAVAEQELPDLHLHRATGEVVLGVGGEVLTIPRLEEGVELREVDGLPEDIDEETPGP